MAKDNDNNNTSDVKPKKTHKVRNTILIILGILVVLGLIGSFMGGGSTNTSTTDNSASTDETTVTETETVEEETPTDYTIGQTADASGITFTLNDAYLASSLGYSTPAEGSIYLVTNWTIKNTTDSDTSVSTANFEAYVDNNAVNTAITADDSIKPLSINELGAGREVSGDLVYEVPADFTTFEESVQSNMFSKYDQLKFVITAAQLEG